MIRDKLSCANSYYKTGEKIIIYDDDKIVASVYPPNRTYVARPSQWIHFYAQNIGTRRKTDPNHMFPFILDRALRKYPCLETTSINKMYPQHINLLVYFCGELLIDNVMVKGMFEYFFNDGTLFHRLFRPIEALSDEIKTLIG